MNHRIESPEEWREWLESPSTSLRGLTAGVLLVKDEQENEFGDVLRLVRTFRDSNKPDPALWRKFLKEEGAAWLAQNINGLEGWKNGSLEKIRGFVDKALEALRLELSQGTSVRELYRATRDAMPGVTALPGDFARRFPGLHELHLWSFLGLNTLPALPNCLRLLDLRNARSLRELPSLPETLEELNLTGCANLESLPPGPLPKLRRLYLSGCGKLTSAELATFVRKGGFLPGLLEVELDGCALTSFPWSDPAPRLRRLTLADCPRLEALPELASWEELGHLDLGGCRRLQALSELPLAKLHFLRLHGCEALGSYLDQDLNERDRGLGARQNVAPTFILRTKLGRGGNPDPGCKLLLLGNGRAGKTTLAKKLIGKPTDAGEPVTHAINRWTWSTALADTSRVADPKARIRIWDFGGQEVYHGTHRVFAASGSVFVIALPCVPAPDKPPAGLEMTPDRWQRMHLPRPPEYWLEYVASLRTDGVRVILAHTQWRRGMPKAPVKLEDLPGHEAWVDRVTVVGEYWVGGLCEGETPTPDYPAFETALRKELARQCAREGARKPQALIQLAREVQARADRADSLDHPDAVKPWAEWETYVLGLLGKHALGTLSAREARTVTRMLHETGDVFHLPDAGKLDGGHVIVGQAVALKPIYGLLDTVDGPTVKLRERVETEFGVFDADVLLPALLPTASPALRDLALHFMVRCEICAPFFNQGTPGVGGRMHLALDPALLPADSKKLRDTLEARWNAMAGNGRRVHRSEKEHWTWSGSPSFSAADFRRLQAWAILVLGNRVRAWEDGLQAAPAEDQVASGWRLRWVSRSGEEYSYGGLLEVTCCCVADAGNPATDALEQARAGLLVTLFSSGAPFPLIHWQQREGGPLAAGAIVAASKEGSEPRPDSRRDVAISTRGVDLDKASQARDWLSAAGLNVYVYDLDAQSENMDQVYEKIRAARLTLLNISQDFLQSSYLDNQWTLRELAEAVLAWAKKRGKLGNDAFRMADNLVAKEIAVMYHNHAQFDFNKHFHARSQAALLAASDHFKSEVLKATTDGLSTETLSGERELFLKALPLVEHFCREFTIDRFPSLLPCACYDDLVPPPKEDLAGRTLFVRRVKQAVEDFRKREKP